MIFEEKEVGQVIGEREGEIPEAISLEQTVLSIAQGSAGDSLLLFFKPNFGGIGFNRII